MNHNQAGTDKLNMLAAGLITALSIHILMCVAAVVSAMGASHVGFMPGILKGLGLLWNLAGIVGGAFVVMQAMGLINGRNFGAARLSAMGALALPLLGSSGLITAFALLPLGLLTMFLMKQPAWQAMFPENLSFESYEVEEVEVDAEVDADVEPELEPALSETR